MKHRKNSKLAAENIMYIYSHSSLAQSEMRFSFRICSVYQSTKIVLLNDCRPIQSMIPLHLFLYYYIYLTIFVNVTVIVNGFDLYPLPLTQITVQK